MIKKQQQTQQQSTKNDDDEGFNTNFFTKVKKREKLQSRTKWITFYSTKRFWMFESQKSK